MTRTRPTPLARVARSGCAVVIGLDAIKSAAGDGWEAMRSSVVVRLESLLRGMLNPTDIFLPIDDLTWLVVMPETAPKDALAGCLMVAFELHVSTLKSCTLDQLKVEFATAVSDGVLELRTPDQGALLAAAECANLSFEPAELAEAPCHPGTARFLPVWDAQSQAVGVYRYVPAGVPRTMQEQLACALIGLKTVVDWLEQHLPGERNLFVVPVSYGVLCAPPARMEYLAACRQLPCQMRPHLLFDVAGMDAYVQQRRLVEIASAIKPFARAVFATVPLRAPSLSIYCDAGFKGLGLAIPEILTGHVPGQIVRLCDAAKRLKYLPFLTNVATPKLAEFALSVGTQWLAGPAIGASVMAPASPFRVTMERLAANFEAVHAAEAKAAV